MNHILHQVRKSMRQVTATLQIGNAREARDVKALHECHVRAVVDLAADEPVAQPTRDLIYIRVPVLDGKGNPAAHLRLALSVICQLLKDEIPTLVACSAGMSRAPVFAAAAIALSTNVPVEAALRVIRENGPCDVAPGLLSDVCEICNVIFEMRKDPD